MSELEVNIPLTQKLVLMRGFQPAAQEDRGRITREIEMAVAVHKKEYGETPHSAAWAPRSVPIVRDGRSGVFVATDGVYALMSVNGDSLPEVVYRSSLGEGARVSANELFQTEESSIQNTGLAHIPPDCVHELMRIRGAQLTLFDTMPLMAPEITGTTLEGVIAKLINTHYGQRVYPHVPESTGSAVLNWGGIASVDTSPSGMTIMQRVEGSGIVDFFRNPGLDLHILSLRRHSPPQMPELHRLEEWGNTDVSAIQMGQVIHSSGQSVFEALDIISNQMRTILEAQRVQKGLVKPADVQELHVRMGQVQQGVSGLHGWFPLSYEKPEVIMFAERIYDDILMAHLSSMFGERFTAKHKVTPKIWRSIDVYPTGPVGCKI